MEPPTSTDSSPSFLQRHEFLIHRLHSLSGLIPVGAYMVVHLVTNASVLNGVDTFQNQVDAIHGLGLLLPIVEWTFIFIPILFHAIIGFVIIRGGISNSRRYPYGRNIRYTLQRVTGVIAFFFILWHVIQLHWLGRPLGGGAFDPHHATSTAAAALQGGVWIPGFVVQALYAVGVLSSVFHLANGLWTMGITWGVWTTAAAQRRADYACMGFGVVLAVIGMSALYGMSTVNVTEARIIEDARLEELEEREQRIEELRSRARDSAQSERPASPEAAGVALEPGL